MVMVGPRLQFDDYKVNSELDNDKNHGIAIGSWRRRAAGMLLFK
jgi:hypothetical protein